jgi:hypothetical protein
MGNAKSVSHVSVPHMSRLSQNSGSYPGNSDKRSPATVKRKRLSSNDFSDYGWYEDFDANSAYNSFTSEYTQQPLHKALTLPAPASEPPLYILESSLETQQLWYATAGRRPPQPPHEREKFEKIWSQNFESSEIPCKISRSTSDLTDKTESSFEVMYRGRPPFSNSVSKSFTGHTISSMTIQLPYYRIVRDHNGVLFAEYLITVSIGGRGSVTFGIWKRHSDFEALAKLITEIDARAAKPHTFKNALLSWQCVLQRKRWFKSLDTEYLALKCFLLERFMQDLLFEAPSAALICDFLGL